MDVFARSKQPDEFSRKYDELQKIKAEKTELEEMNHDLTMFISSQEKVKELQAQGEEIAEGSISVPEQHQQDTSQGKKKGKGRKK